MQGMLDGRTHAKEGKIRMFDGIRTCIQNELWLKGISKIQAAEAEFSRSVKGCNRCVYLKTRHTEEAE
jgi:hypothetical protein